MSIRSTLWAVGICLFCFSVNLFAQEPYPGWNFLNNSTGSSKASLYDLEGNEVHFWQSSFGTGHGVYLIDDGKIIRAARDDSVHPFSGPGAGGRIQRIAFDGTIEWNYVAAGADFVQHHDLVPMPNGNVLFSAWERHTPEEAIALGRDPATLGAELWSELIVEVEPVGSTGGNIVWTWRAWDHMIQDFDPTKPNFGTPSDNPGKIDINYFNAESIENWMHANALDYNEELDQVIVSIRHLHEVWILDHSPASSGDILYRYGNPEAYGRGTASDRFLWGSHNVHWIKSGLRGEGNLLMFNNGFNFSGSRDFSTVDEFRPPLNGNLEYDLVDGQPFQPLVPDETVSEIGGLPFFSNIMSSAQRLPNGNTFVLLGRPGVLLEYDEFGNEVFQQSVNQITFLAHRVGFFDSRLEGHMWESVGSDSFNVESGLLWSGQLSDLAASDDQVIEMRRNQGAIVMTAKGIADSIVAPSQVNVQLESRHFVSTDSRRPVVVSRQIELFNYVTNQFDIIETGVSQVADSLLEVTVDEDASNYVDPSSGCVEARLTFTKDGLARGLRIQIDHVEVRVVR